MCCIDIFSLRDIFLRRVTLEDTSPISPYDVPPENSEDFSKEHRTEVIFSRKSHRAEVVSPKRSNNFPDEHRTRAVSPESLGSAVAD